MKKVKYLWTYLILGLILASCAGVAHIEKDDTVNFSDYKTFAWVETSATKGEKVEKVSDLTEQKIKEAVNAELAKQGWKEVGGKPDVLLTYDVLVEKNLKEQTNPVYSRSFTRWFFNPYTGRWAGIYYPSQFLGYDRAASEVKEGTITISMIDAKTDKTILQGWTTDEVASRNLTSKEIQSAVRSIFRKFDVAKS